MTVTPSFLTAAEPVTLGLEFDNYTVNEGDSVRVCVHVLNGPLDTVTVLQLKTAALNSGNPGIHDVFILQGINSLEWTSTLQFWFLELGCQ